MSPRPREFDENEVLDKAMRLFWRQGYEATSIQDLVAETALNRASLYNAFGGKKKLFCLCLDRYMTQQIQPMNTLFARNGDPIESIHEFFAMMLQRVTSGTGERGCLLHSAMNELAERDDEIRALLLRYHENLVTIFAQTLKRAQESGHWPADADPRRMALFLDNALRGMAILAKARPQESEIRHIMDATLVALRHPHGLNENK